MGTNYIGEVRLVGFNFQPVNWLFCNGQLLSIAGNEALYNLIGTTYGGDGQNTFGLPNLQGRLPMHQGSNGVTPYSIGQSGGVEGVTIVQNSYPTHNHQLLCTNNNGSSSSPGGSVLAAANNVYSAAAPSAAMNSAALGAAPGGNQPHANVQPYQALNWIIGIFGIYPSQN